MFLTFIFRSAPEEGLYCKPKYRAKKLLKKKQKKKTNIFQLF